MHSGSSAQPATKVLPANGGDQLINAERRSETIWSQCCCGSARRSSRNGCHHGAVDALSSRLDAWVDVLAAAITSQKVVDPHRRRLAREGSPCPALRAAVMDGQHQNAGQPSPPLTSDMFRQSSIVPSWMDCAMSTRSAISVSTAPNRTTIRGAYSQMSVPTVP